MGGMAGVQEAMAGNPAMSGLAGQMGAMMEKMGMPGGADGVQNMMSQFTGQQAAAGGAAAAGLGGLLTALGGAAAAGTEEAGQMKAQVYATSLMAIRVDHVREAQYLDALAGALDLSPEMRETVHRSIGVT